MQQISSPKMKKLENWREEYLALRRQIFCFDEDEDVFSLFKLNSKDLKYKGIIRRLQIEFNEDNFNRDLERNEMLTQIQIMRREQGTVLRRMDENWQNPRMMNYLRVEAAKLIEKQNNFKNFHGQNFTYIEEEKDNLIKELDQFNPDAFTHIDYSFASQQNHQNRKQQSSSPRGNPPPHSQSQSPPKHEGDLKKKRKMKKKRREFKSQEGLAELVQGQDTSKKSSSDTNEDETIEARNQKENMKGKKQQLSIEGNLSQQDLEDIDVDHDDRPTYADIFVTQDKIKKQLNNQYLSKVSELPEEESRQMTQKFSSHLRGSNSSKGKSNLISPKGDKYKFADESFLRHVQSEQVDAEEALIYNKNLPDDIVVEETEKQEGDFNSQSPQRNHKRRNHHSKENQDQYSTPKKHPQRQSPRKKEEQNSLERDSQYQKSKHEESLYQQNSTIDREYSKSPPREGSKQNISLLDKSLNNISNIEEDEKDMQQIKDFVKKIDDLMRDLGGVNCGWKESDHRSFLLLMKKYGHHGLRSKEAMADSTVAVLSYYTDKELLDHINSYNQYNMLLNQKQKYIEEYKQITQRIEKRKQVELGMLKQIRKERELSQLKERIHSTVQRTELYVKQFEDIKRKYKDVETKSSLEYQKRQKMREKEVYNMVQRRQTQKEMQQAISSKKSQQEIKKANMLKEINQNEKINNLIPRNYHSNNSPQNPQNQESSERIFNIQKELYVKYQQLEELRLQSKSKRLQQHTYFTPQIKRKQFSPPRMKMAAQIY